MSAALQLPIVWGTTARKVVRVAAPPTKPQQKVQPTGEKEKQETAQREAPEPSLAFYRRHTESMLRRYLYASMQVGSAPSILGEPIGRGWVSSRPVRTFEDAVIFVLDVEQCLKRLNVLDRYLLSKVVLQEFTHGETAAMLGMSMRAVSYKVPKALDRLTEKLLESGLLVFPQS